jgi:hypothetical protein
MDDERSPEAMVLSFQVLVACSPVSCADWFCYRYAASAPLVFSLHLAYRISPDSRAHPVILL